MADYTPFPLSPWYERPDVSTPARSHKVMAAGPNGNGGVESKMLSVEQVLSLINANDMKPFADPRTARVAKSIDYAATVDDNRKIIAFTVAGKTLTLPRASFALAASDGFMIVVSAEAGAVTVARSGTDTIIGATSITINQGEVAQFFLDSSSAGWRAAIASAYATNAKLDSPNVFSKRQHLAKGSNIASGTALVLPDNGNFFDVTGTATITSISTVTQAGTRVMLRALGAWTLQHNAASLILPRAANLTVAAGDVLELVSLGGGNYLLTSVTRADGTALVASSDVAAFANLNLAATPIIRAAKNVSSITKNASGDWRANYTTALVDGFSSPVLCAPPSNGRQPFLFDGNFNSGNADITASGFRFAYGAISTGALIDVPLLTFIVCR